MYREKVGKNKVKLLSCKESLRFWAEGHAEEAPLWDRLAFRMHLVGCLLCRKYVRQLQAVGRAFAQYSRENVSSQRITELKERILHTLSL